MSKVSDEKLRELFETRMLLEGEKRGVAAQISAHNDTVKELGINLKAFNAVISRALKDRDEVEAVDRAMSEYETSLMKDLGNE